MIDLDIDSINEIYSQGGGENSQRQDNKQEKEDDFLIELSKLALNCVKHMSNLNY